MSALGDRGRNGTELILSPISSEGSEGAVWGTNGTTPFRGVPLSPCPPASSDRSRSATCAALEGESLEGPENASPHLASRPFSPAPPEGGRDKPLKGAGPVPLSPNSVPRARSLVFQTEAEGSDFWERAAIREFDGGQPRAVAERLAWLEVVAARSAAPDLINNQTFNGAEPLRKAS